jgi:Polysaccharide biosynthesis protein
MSAVGLVIAQAATVVQTLVIGRLLGPHEVGVFVAGSVMIGFLAQGVDGSLSQALIQRKTEVEDAANTALVVNFGTGLLVSLALLAASPVVGTLVPQFANRSGRSRDLRTDTASCLCERRNSVFMSGFTGSAPRRHRACGTRSARAVHAAGGSAIRARAGVRRAGRRE